MCIPRTLDHLHMKVLHLQNKYINHEIRGLLRSLYSNHDRSVLIPAQERVLSVPRLCVFNISPSLEEVLVLHDASELSSDGAVDCFVDRKVCGEENVEETLMDLRADVSHMFVQEVWERDVPEEW